MTIESSKNLIINCFVYLVWITLLMYNLKYLVQVFGYVVVSVWLCPCGCVCVVVSVWLFPCTCVCVLFLKYLVQVFGYVVVSMCLCPCACVRVVVSLWLCLCACVRVVVFVYLCMCIVCFIEHHVEYHIASLIYLHMLLSCNKVMLLLYFKYFVTCYMQ